MRHHDLLRLECCALHTETPAWAEHAPAQATAAYRRGAHGIGFSEVTPVVAPGLAALAIQYGYRFIHGGGDTAIALQGHLSVRHLARFVHVAGLRGYTEVTFRFHGSDVTLLNQHWGTNKPDHHATRVAQTHALIEKMHQASAGHRIAFYMGDCNPDGPLSDPGTFPRHDLDAAGLPLIYEELDSWPPHIGVSVIGRNKADLRVEPVAVDLFDPLGSDHYPVLGQYRIIRRKHLTAQQPDPSPLPA